MSSYQNRRRADANRANSQLSTGPRTETGKATVSTNATKHGLTAHLQRLDPRDSPAYQQNLTDLTTGLAPANPAEEFLIRDLAMLKSRLDRLEAAEYTVLMSVVDGQTTDESTAYLAAAPQLATLEKTERFLRRNYMQTWSRLERMQRDRKREEERYATRAQKTGARDGRKPIHRPHPCKNAKTNPTHSNRIKARTRTSDQCHAGQSGSCSGKPRTA
jgi:hypothetical protein